MKEVFNDVKAFNKLLVKVVSNKFRINKMIKRDVPQSLVEEYKVIDKFISMAKNNKYSHLTI